MYSQVEILNAMQALRESIARTMPDNPVLSGWGSYSQCDEDGIIRECLRRIGEVTPLSQTFLEIGCADGLENNTHQLALDGYTGVWIDGASEKLKAISTALGGLLFSRLWAIEAMVTRDSSTVLAARAAKFLETDSVDFFSLDVDGNDIHVCPEFLQALNPKLVCVEYNAKFAPPTRLAMQYKQDHVWNGDDYFGVSLQAWNDLFEANGYTLVSCNLSGANAFFVRNDLLAQFTVYPVVSLFQPARYALVEVSKGHRPSLSWLRQSLHADESGRRFISAQTKEAAIGQFAVHVKPDQFISGDILRDGLWEPFESQVFSRLCQPGDTVLDLGANIGWYSSLAVAKIGAKGSVLAFEPDDDNARLFEINAVVQDPYGVITLRRHAVGDLDGQVSFYKSDSNLGDHRLFSDGTSREEKSVPVMRLDTLFADAANHALPGILKIDTQGSEAKILRGARGLFARGWRPVMILEFWPFGLTQSGDDPMQLWETLVGLGYKAFEVSEANPHLVSISSEKLQSRVQGDISAVSGNFINILCVPAGSARLDFVRDLIVDA